MQDAGNSVFPKKSAKSQGIWKKVSEKLKKLFWVLQILEKYQNFKNYNLQVDTYLRKSKKMSIER